MKRLQVMLKDETFERVNDALKKCNENFEDGTVKLHDFIDWMLFNSPFEIQKIRAKCLMANRIKNNAKLEYKEDIDELIKKLSQIKPLMKSKEDK